jgi:osmoprotectant transport system ATP-binding protein
MAAAASPAEAIVFDGVVYGAAGREILRGVSLSIAAGERVALLGRSGAGKTTLLRAVNALTIPTGGEVRVLGRALSDWDVLELRRHCGYVLQDGGLFPHMTCEENVRLPLRLQNVGREEQDKRARELFSMVGLELGEFGARRPRQLSGGQRQRVGVARALAVDAQVLLMDEPFGALDPLTRDEMQELMTKLLREFPRTMVMVTHDLNEALRLASRIVLMDQGAIVVDLPAGEFASSKAPLVEKYLRAFRPAIAEGADG